MARLPLPGGDDNRWGDILNGFLEVSHDESGAILPGAIGSSQLQDGSVTSTKVVDGAVTSAKLADNAVASSKMADNSVTSAKLADASVTPSKLAGDIPKSALSASVQQSLDNADAAVANSGMSRVVGTVTASVLLPSVANYDYVYFCSGTITVMLPSAVGNTNLYTLKNTGAGSITVVGSDTQTIDGALSVVLDQHNMLLSFLSDGSNWKIV